MELLPALDTSTEGRSSVLLIVISLAERGPRKDAATGGGGDGVLDRDIDTDPGGTSCADSLGKEKHPPNTSWVRNGCQGGRDGSGTMAKMASMSSIDNLPSLSRSNWWKVAVKKFLPKAKDSIF